MLKISVTIVALIAGITATKLCDEPIQRICTDDNAPIKFPETTKELQELCSFAIGFYECVVEYSENCNHEYYLDDARVYLRVFKEVCDEDTLLHTVLVDNLKCLNELAKTGGGVECYRLMTSPSIETLHKYAEALIEEGFPALSHDETEVNITLSCIHSLQELACYGTKLEDECGRVAMDGFVEIVQKIAPITRCGEMYDYLPAVIHIYKLEKEQADEVAEVFKKRK